MGKGERIETVLRGVVEVITREELAKLLETTDAPKGYWGFETSGLMHIGIGLVCGGKIRDLVEAGFRFTIFLADWHSWINNKLGGDFERIRLCGEYFKQCFTAIGIAPSRVEYRWASDLTSRKEYWERVLRVAKGASVNRVWRALPIMGRTLDAERDLDAASTFYPCMQVADIFELGVDVACAGIDQRKAHVLARDVAEKNGWPKPVCLHTNLLPGLTGPKRMGTEHYDENPDLNLQVAAKMSKSIPEANILIHDEPDEIKRKILNAYCPSGETEGNPVYQIAANIIIPWKGSIEIQRPAKYGRETVIQTTNALKKEYEAGSIHPLDLKNSASEALIDILKPVREEFHQRSELLARMREFEMTR